jgi:transposase-like protein
MDTDADHVESNGGRQFNCRSCKRRFNGRTGTPFNDLQVPTDMVLLAVLWRLRYKLSFRDVAEMLLQSGVEVTHETIREWEFRFAPLLTGQLRAKRRARAGESWYLDETYAKVAGRLCYLYRAIDGDGELIDSMLSEHRDTHAARRFLRTLVEITERKPARITTDLHPAYRRAIHWITGRKAWHRTTQYLNYTEQSHRAVKQRYYRCRASGASSPRRASVPRSMSYDSTSAFDDAVAAMSHCPSRDDSSSCAGAR